MRRLLRLIVGAVSAAIAIGGSLSPVAVHAAYPPNGTVMGVTNFATQCGSGIGVGVAFDGTYLWYTCYGGSPDLLRANPTTGAVSASYNIASGLGAIAYDSTRNAIWAGPGGSTSNGHIFLIHLDSSQNVTTSAIAFSPGADVDFLDDGVAYDASNDTLYFKPDNSNPIHHYTTAGVKLTDITGASSCFGPDTSGLAIGGNLLFEGKDGCQHVFVVDKVTNAPAFDFSTAAAGTRDEGLSCDTKTFAPVQVMWSKEAYSPMRAVAFSIPAGTCGVGGKPAAGAPPEVYSQFNPADKKVHLFCKDVGGAGCANTGPQVPTSSVPGTWNTENGPVPVFFQTYNVCDTGGNCSLVHVIVTQDWLNLSIRDIQYGNGQTMTPAQNLLSAQYLLNEMGQLAELHQQAYIGNALDDAEWSLKTNVTHLRHIRPDPPSSQSLPGMVLYQIVTDKGAVKLTHT